MTERPRELDQRFQMGGQFEAIIDWGVTFRAIATRRNLLLASYGKQTIYSTRPSCWIGYRSRRRRRRCANNIAADYQCW